MHVKVVMQMVVVNRDKCTLSIFLVETLNEFVADLDVDMSDDKIFEMQIDSFLGSINCVTLNAPIIEDIPKQEVI